ncbi:MAG: ABC transporter permease [Corynebacterium sp.]|nr:ABC transporter permease [Corynebacterium sp.]
MGTLLFFEIRKALRLRMLLTLVVLLGLESLWIAALSIRYWEMDHLQAYHSMGLLMTNIPQVHSLLMPIFLTVFASRLASMEHDANTFKLFFSTRISPAQMFWAKMIPLSIINLILSAGPVCIIVLLAKALVVELDTKVLLLQFVGSVLAGFAVTAIQLFLALAFEKQQIALLVGGAGGILGAIAGVIPNWICWFIPWQYFTLLAPVLPAFSGGSFAGLNYQAHMEVRLLFVLVVGVVAAGVCSRLFEKIALK